MTWLANGVVVGTFGEVIAKLKLKPGDVVADIGSGSGAFSIIAPSGVAKGFYRHSSY